MYLFVRVTAVIFIILGLLLMVAAVLAVAGGMLGFVTGGVPFQMGPNLPTMTLAPVGTLVFGIAFFLQGLLIAALGQVMLVFADIARNTEETNRLLRSGVRPVQPIE